MVLIGVPRRCGSTPSPNTKCGSTKSILISFTSKEKGQLRGDPADAFAVVAPSLPGYGLSFSPGQPRFGVEEIADCFASLMTDVLGYQQFGAQGGNWGS